MARSSTGLRDRLPASALRLFVQHGFRGTSLAVIPVTGPTDAAAEDTVHAIRAKVTAVQGAKVALTGTTAPEPEPGQYAGVGR